MTLPRSDRPMPAMEGARHHWVTANGVRLHVAEFGRGEPVVLLHGFPQHWFGWRRLVPLLAGEYRLICVDLRGFGWSEQPKRGYDNESLASDVLALLDALGLERVALVGHDWGAQVGFRLCLRAPRRCVAFLALNATHPWPLHRKVLPNLWRMWFTAFIEYPVLGRAVLRRWPAFTRFLLRRGVADRSVWAAGEIEEFTAAAQVSAHAGQAMFWQFVVREIPALLRGTLKGLRLTVPTVIVGGARDRVLPPGVLAGGERYADDLTVRVLPGVGHHAHEERPEDVAAEFRGLFARAILQACPDTNTAAGPVAPPLS